MVLPAAWRRAEQLHDLQLVVEVEVVERLVEQQDGRLLGQGLRDEGPLALAAGELGDQAPGEGGHAGRLERGGHGCAVGRPAAGRGALRVGVAAHGHHLLNSEAKVEVELLGHHSHHAGQFARRGSWPSGRPSSRTSPADGLDAPR